jgi:HlyD family secretion protein
MKRLIPIVILLALATGGGIWWHTQQAKKAAPRTELALSGNIEAHEAQVSFKVQGRIAELPVEEGQQVTAGTLLARLEDADFRQRVRMDESSVAVRASNLALANAGTRQQEIKAAEQAVADAAANLEQRKLEDERARQLYAKDEVSAQDRDLAATALKRAHAALEQVQQRLNEAREGTRKEEIAIAQANLAQANASLGLSRIDLDYATLRAPSTGVVTVRQAELGEVVSPGSPVVTLADLDHIWLRAYVAETDLGRIHFGQDVVVTTDTYPGKQYRGRISFIASNAEFTPKSVQTYQERVTLVYRIKIDVENPNHELKPGMPADAHIALNTAANTK